MLCPTKYYFAVHDREFFYRQVGRSWPEPGASGLRVLDEGDRHR